jgi:hypothetical protein
MTIYIDADSVPQAAFARPPGFGYAFRVNSSPAKFSDALACVETLPVEDQTELIQIVNKRIASVRRREMLQEIEAARADYAKGNVKRGSASALMRELRAK